MNESVTTLLTMPVAQVMRVERVRYEVVRHSILKNLYAFGPLTHEELGALVENHLKLKLNDLAAWQYIVVEQDLELCGEIRSVPDSNPQLIEVNL